MSVGGSRKTKSWKPKTLPIDEFYKKLGTPVVGTETHAEYMKMSKAERDDLKDVGGFVLAHLKNGKRDKDTVLDRTGINLDADTMNADQFEKLKSRLAESEFSYALYSTRKHSASKPRARIIIPFVSAVSPDICEAAARKIAQKLDPSMSVWDETAFKPNQLMYWPSVSADVEFVYRSDTDSPLLDAEAYVENVYDDWLDIGEWPLCVSETTAIDRSLKRQKDPLGKPGLIGALCRTYYPIAKLFDKGAPLDGVYIPTDDPNRWSYAKGSTSGGAIVYDDRFIYSHHATDPAGGELCNAWDLIRFHLYGDLDADEAPGTPTEKLPSYKALQEWALADEKTQDLMSEENKQQADEDFADIKAADSKPLQEVKSDPDWWKKLDKAAKTGLPLVTIRNVQTALTWAPVFAGRIRLNTLSGHIEVRGGLPWDTEQDENSVRDWSSAFDDAGLRRWCEAYLKFGRPAQVIEDGMLNTAKRNEYDPLKDYIESLEWDGTRRLDTVFIDYFGEEDTPYARQTARKFFCAGVARALRPGTKFDEMLVISGPQGSYKSTFAERIGKNWYMSVMVNFKDLKSVAETIQGFWILEIPELSAFSKADSNHIKQMISQTGDTYRAAYARMPETHLRRSLMIGTTNDKAFLKDPTGNRRYWIIEVNPGKVRKNVWNDLTSSEVDQLWAEAAYYYGQGESLILDGEAEKAAEARRQNYTDEDEWKGLIEEYLEKPIPSDWYQRSKDEMFAWLYNERDMADEDDSGMEREKVCVAEIYEMCLGGRPTNMSPADRKRIQSIMNQMPGWESGRLRRYGRYGRIRGWSRVSQKPSHLVSR